MLHCSTTHTLARTRAYQYFCFLLSHLSQHSQQRTKNLIINTINLTSKWQTTHSAVTLLSHHPSSTTTPPHRAKFAVTLLSHYYHITVTPLSPKPFLLQKSTSFLKESVHSLEKVPYFPEKVPHFPEDVRHFLEKVPYFLEKVGHNWRECSPWLRSPVTDVTEKNTKLLVYTRARARKNKNTFGQHGQPKPTPPPFRTQSPKTFINEETLIDNETTNEESTMK